MSETESETPQLEVEIRHSMEDDVDHMKKVVALVRFFVIGSVLAFIYFAVIGFWRADQLDQLEDKASNQAEHISALEQDNAVLRAENSSLDNERETLETQQTLLIAHVQTLMIQLNAALGLPPTTNHTEEPVPSIPDDPIHEGIPPGTPNPHEPTTTTTTG